VGYPQALRRRNWTRSSPGAPCLTRDLGDVPAFNRAIGRRGGGLIDKAGDRGRGNQTNHKGGWYLEIGGCDMDLPEETHREQVEK
jgi:hypothetical protein